MKFVKAKLRIRKSRGLCAALLLVFATAAMSAASCVTELATIVKTAQGRVKGLRGEAIVGAEVTVTSSTGDEIFHTKSRRDGSFRLAIDSGRYRVEVEAHGYLRLEYIVDLRSSVAVEPVDLFLQSVNDCHDIHIVSEQETRDREETKCSSEELPSNLILRNATTLGGQVRDESGAPFKNSQIVLRAVSAIPLQPGYLVVKTDADGAFVFDESEPGEYRLLASPNRGFAQPAKLDCYERRDCNLEIVLKVNGTDSPYAGCPLR